MPSSPPSAGAATAPWADLLPELCGLVMDRLGPISILRFRAVCRGWFAAYKEYPAGRRLRSGAPMLLTSGLDPDGCGIECDVDAGAFFGLHDVSAGGGGNPASFLGEEAHHQGLKGRTWIGGKDDWLATTDYGCDVELLNPVTGARVRLPSFATIPGVTVRGYLHVFTTGDRVWHKIVKVTLCRTPAHPDGHLAVALFTEGLLAFTASGGGNSKDGECWTALQNPAGPVSRRLDLSYVDAIVLEGKLFAVNELGGVYVWDMDGGGGTTAVVRGPAETESSRHYWNWDESFYLAAAPSSVGGGQRLLLICIYGGDPGLCRDSRAGTRMAFDDRRGCFYELGVSLHELDLDAGVSGTWRRVTGLGGDGDRALFVGANYPFYATVRRRRGSEDKDDEDSRPCLEAGECVFLADTPYGYDASIFDPKKGEGGGSVKRLAYSLVAEPLHMPMWFRPTNYPLTLVSG